MEMEPDDPDDISSIPDSIVSLHDPLRWVNGLDNESIMIKVEADAKGFLTASSLFLKVAWLSLTKAEKEIFILEAEIENIARISLTGDFGVGNKMVVSSSMVIKLFLKLSDDDKLLFANEAKRVNEGAKTTLRRWGTEPKIVIENIPGLVSDLQLEIRWTYQKIHDNIVSQLSRKTLDCSKSKKWYNVPYRVKKLKKLIIRTSVGATVFKHFWRSRLEKFEIVEAGSADTSFYAINTLEGIREVFEYHGRVPTEVHSSQNENSIVSSMGIKVQSVGSDDEDDAVEYLYMLKDQMVLGESKTEKYEKSQFLLMAPRIRYNRKKQHFLLIFPRFTTTNGLLNTVMSS